MSAPVTKPHYCQCGCGGELPLFVDHASRATRYLPGHFDRELLQRFVLDEETDCWDWTGCVTSAGHGQICVRAMGGTMTAHRFFYLVLVGPIGEGMTLHHICENKLCVNPAHMVQMGYAEHRRHHANLKWSRQKADPSLRLIGPTHAKPGEASQVIHTPGIPGTTGHEHPAAPVAAPHDPALAPVAGAGLGGGR